MSATEHAVTTGGSLLKTLTLQRQAFVREGRVTARIRRDRLDRLARMLKEHEGVIADTVVSDFGGRSLDFTRYGEVASLLKLLRHARRNLEVWMRDERRRPEFPLGLFGASAWVRWEPKGVVGLIGPWNYPVFLTFAPLIDVLAAGNRAMVKPSELTPATSDLMADLIGRFFDDSELAVCVGGIELGRAFSRLPFDHLVFTGGTTVGRQVMAAAAENLVPVTLELGGKCPAIVGRSARFDHAVDNIVLGKLINSGQMCMGVDHVFVPEEDVDRFVQAAVRMVRSAYPSLAANQDYTAVISDRHLRRLRALIEEARDRGARVEEINPAGEDLSDGSLRKLPPTLIVNPDVSARVMQEEVFGPVLPVIGYGAIDEVVARANRLPLPLALYYFGTDPHELEAVLSRVPSGGVTVNGVILHAVSEDLPFGGIGGSGMGKIHGIDGFRTFSHGRAVFAAPRVSIWKLLGLRPPYGRRLRRLIAWELHRPH